MTQTRAKWLLRAFCLWTFFVWIVFIKNMVTDNEHELAFKLVHISPAVVSLAFAAVAWPLSNRIGPSGKADR